MNKDRDCVQQQREEGETEDGETDEQAENQRQLYNEEVNYP